MTPKRTPKNLTLKASKKLTKNMLRLTFQGEDLASLPNDTEGAYFKIAFQNPDSDKPIMRTYTVAKYRADLNEIDVDFVLHGSDEEHVDGVAASWAVNAVPGDKIAIFGPGPATFINTQADWFLLAADMTALPALTANLATLPENAQGYLLIEVLSEEDKQELPSPTNMEVRWVVNPEAGSDATPLHDQIRELPWLKGQVAAWAACEFKTMKKIRQYFRAEKAVEKTHLYISSYWKKGLNEEDHKVVKHEDAALMS